MDNQCQIWHPYGRQPNKERKIHLLEYMIRQIQRTAKISDEVRLEALEKAVPYATLQAVVRNHGLQRQRSRKLSAEMGLMILIAMNLFSHNSLAQVLWKIISGVRLVWPGPKFTPATKGAISQLRYEIGAKPMVDLYHRVCQLMATEATPGAFWKGMRLMGMDGTDEMVADTPENEAFFGRHTSGRGEAGYPQLKAIYLVEIGTHAVIDAGAWPIHSGEKEIGKRMLRFLEKGMLVMWDCGFHSLAMVRRAMQPGADILGRLPANVKVHVIRRLPDGSTLITLAEHDHKGKPKEGSEIRLRLIEYTVSDPALPGFGEHRRLITSLLDEQTYPAIELARLYHERWEVEITIDETATHQRRAFQPFRSLKPVGVIQEFFGRLIAHYAVRKIMHDAALLANLDPDRLSFTNALSLIQEAVHDFQIIPPALFANHYLQLLLDIASFKLPPRVPRSNPRVVKRKMSNFDKKRPAHRHWPQPACAFADAIVLI
jgi:hypothetical protein